MLTPKEKAEQIVDKYYKLKSMKLSDYSIVYYPFAKLAALSEVDGLIEWSKQWVDEEILTPALIYLENVKKEIEKL